MANAPRRLKFFVARVDVSASPAPIGGTFTFSPLAPRSIQKTFGVAVPCHWMKLVRQLSSGERPVNYGRVWRARLAVLSTLQP